jgi:lipoate-protein ligase A
MTFSFDPPLDGHANMARDSALLEGGEPAARLYTWDGPWVSLGRSQDPNLDLAPGNSVPWVRRPTGGMAVLHGHDWTVALALPLSALDLECRSVREVYRRLVNPVVVALRRCGLDAALAEDTTFAQLGRSWVADCFAFRSPNDVVDRRTGHKVCGCALRVTRIGALLQASIPKEAPLVDPATVIPGAATVSPLHWDTAEFPAAWSMVATCADSQRLTL